jgi:hypothetical protein
MRRFARLGFAVCGLLLVGGTAAWATGLLSVGFVASDGTITACVQNANGHMRLLDPSSSRPELRACRRNETQISFDQTGQ